MQNWIKTVVVAVSLALPGVVLAQSLESLVNVQGVRENQLVGYSLVVGLDGTGDKNQVKFTNQTITNMLRQFGVQLPNKIDPKVKNVAAVAVSATLPPMYSRGQTIDVTVSSIGDAKSIRGGTLLLTQLHGADGEVYALAQGSVVVGGMNATGASGSSVTVNTPTAGLIPNGATVEREIPSDFQMGDTITLNQGDEYIRLSGLVRADDIQNDNSVSSQRIADARISYAGRGALSDANAAGWLTRLFNHPLFPI